MRYIKPVIQEYLTQFDKRGVKGEMWYDTGDAQATITTNSGIFMRGKVHSGTQPFLISGIPANSEW